MEGDKRKGLSSAAISLWVAVVAMLLYLVVGVAIGALVPRV